MNCKKHPKYKAVYKPRVECPDCQKMYEDRLMKTVTAYLRAGKKIKPAAKALGCARKMVRDHLKKAINLGLYAGSIGDDDNIKEEINVELGQQKGVVTTKSLNIQTVPEAIAASGIDTQEWEVYRSKTNSWEVTMGADKTNTGKPETYTNYQVTLWIEKRKDRNAVKAIEGLIKRIPVLKIPKPKTIQLDPTEFAQEMALYDVHFAKLAWGAETGQGDYDLKIAQDWFLKAAEINLQYGSPYPRSKIYYVLGQDLMHVENFFYETPMAGHHLDVDSRLPKIFEVVMESVIKVLYMCREVAPVEVLWVPGNHDMHSSFYLAHVLKQHFKDDKYVEIDVSPPWRKARLWGNLLVGFTHDASTKQSETVNILPQFWPKEWGKSKYRELHTGHKHKKEEIKYKPTQTVGGTIIRQIPTMSVIDKWHFDEKFVDAVPGGESFIWSKKNGVVAHYTAYVS